MGRAVQSGQQRAGALPWATLVLVVLTCAVYGLQLLHPGGVAGATEQWGQVPQRLAAGEAIPGTRLPQWLTLLTYLFLHSGWPHLKGNMLALALAGAALERRAGTGRLLLVYFGSGILTAVVIALAQWYSGGSLCGSSGAVCGVLLAWALLLPGSWRSGWFAPGPGWRNAASLLEALWRSWRVAKWLGYLVFWPLAVAAFSGNWNVLAYRTDLTHVAGALFGALLILPYAVQCWRRRGKAAVGPECVVGRASLPASTR